MKDIDRVGTDVTNPRGNSNIEMIFDKEEVQKFDYNGLIHIWMSPEVAKKYFEGLKKELGEEK